MSTKNPILVNHVLSSNVESSIFNAIFDYHRRFAPQGAQIRVSAESLPDATLYHYHRPHLEPCLSQPAVVTVHHDLTDPDPWLALSRFLPRYREAKLVVCLNRTQQALLARHGINHTVVISHGYNGDVLRPKTTKPRDQRSDGKITFGFLSRYYDRRVKGEAYLSDLVKALDAERIAFILVGRRRNVTAEQLSRLGYEVRCYQHLPYALFQDLYEAIDYLLVTSNFEGGPASLPEAMATHTPIISTRVGFAPDFLDDGQTGLLLTGVVDEDAPRILRLTDPSDPLTRALDEGAPTLAATCPTWREVVQSHFEAYLDLLR